MKHKRIIALCGACMLACLAPAAVLASPGFMTCQVFDGARDRIFYSARPVAAGSDSVDNAYDFYLRNVVQSGLMGDVGKSRGNCNWEPSRDAAATKGAAFVKYFVDAGANPFPDRYMPDPYLYHITVTPSAPQQGAAPAPAAPAATPSAIPTVTLSEGSGGICRVEVRSATGRAEAKMQMEAGLMKGLRYLLIPTLRSAPGRGAAKGGEVLVHFDMNVISLGTTDFDGLGTRLTFPAHTVTGPIDLRVTIGDVVLRRAGLMPDANGSYGVRMGGGPLETNAALKAIDKASVIEVFATPSGAADQALVYADVPIGAPDDRDALTQSALDAVEQRAKAGC